MYYSIGTPLGMMDQSGEYSFSRDGEIYKIERKAFRIWTFFLHGMELKDAIRLSVQKGIAEADEAETLVNQLSGIEMIVSESGLLEHKPARQGQGIGYNPSSDNASIFLNKKIQVNYGDFLLWCYCDGKSTLSEVINKVEERFFITLKRSNVFSIINELLKNNLLVFSE